jgi:hypothetical protein
MMASSLRGVLSGSNHMANAQDDWLDAEICSVLVEPSINISEANQLSLSLLFRL